MSNIMSSLLLVFAVDLELVYNACWCAWVALWGGSMLWDTATIYWLWI